ncbi:thioesterase family protein [Ureibacillus sp. FSL K6-8385]|uniref:Acyl-CoA thioesterase n=1 Tax=Ureibacillus terrenus TaxID=118246 RepID=A0A540V1L7_9BACL|nr:thioesterase family protein [Ureibacillus terrenus]MED3764693.1 thioesterase family protein [Ureibacillus terrenus]TQE90654.1 acyl-CoA thioesterase [Ureibacillus terrenus]
MEYQFKIPFGDTDAAGIVYYPNYYRYMDNATHEFFEKIGYPTEEMLEKKQAIPLLEAHCNFFAPGRFHRIITVKTSVGEIRDKVFKLIHQFKDQDTVIAEGYEVRAWVSLDGGKPKAQPIPEELKHKLQRYQTGG